jgi:hypothetical protein
MQRSTALSLNRFPHGAAKRTLTFRLGHNLESHKQSMSGSAILAILATMLDTASDYRWRNTLAISDPANVIQCRSPLEPRLGGRWDQEFSRQVIRLARLPQPPAVADSVLHGCRCRRNEEPIAEAEHLALRCVSDQHPLGPGG